VPEPVRAGGKSPAPLREASAALARILPDARHRTLEGQSQNVSVKLMAPIVQEFFAVADDVRREARL
jgi:hypothetical protein